jgi:copper transport protein
MDSAPKSREQLDAAPKEVSVTFNESVGPVFFRVLDQSGREVGAPGEIRLEGAKMIMPLGESLPNGTYVMTYRVISADTHPVGATIVFSVGGPIADAGALAAAQAPTKSAWTWAVALNRWVLYAAMLTAAGSAFFLTLFSVPPAVVASTVTLARTAAAVAALAYIVAIGVGGAEMQLAGAGALFDAATWSRGLASTLLPSAVIGVPAMLLLWWALGRSRERPASGALTAGAAIGIASFLVTGHAATAPPVWLMATMVGSHLLATSFWMGALFPLQRATAALGPVEAGALMTRFSRLGVLAVAVSVLSGMVVSWVQLAGPANLLGNDYGESLIRKLVIVAAVIGIALYNKFRLTPALERGDAGATARIRRSIRVEYALYVLVVGAAMSLTLPTPPRATAAQAGAAGATAGMAMASEGFRTTVQSAEGYSVEIDLSPARPGENMLMATVRDPAGKVLTELAALEVVIALEAAGISDVRMKGENVGNGMWHAMIQEMLIPGDWTMSVEAYVTDFDRITFTTLVTIR